MGIPKPSGIDDLVPDSAEYQDDAGDILNAAKKNERKLLKLRNPQAWRALEDRLDELRLKRRLQEYYEDD